MSETTTHEDPDGPHPEGWPFLAQVRMDYNGRVLLGDVIDFHEVGPGPTAYLTVRHFNGEPWPVSPTAAAVEVLPR